MTTEIARLRGRLALAAIAAVFALGAAPALAATHYAAPNGTAGDWPCEAPSSPCDLATAIQGTGAQQPASGDEVVITGTTYNLTDEMIKATVPENIHGAAGEPAPQINDAFNSGTTGETIAALQIGGSDLTHVRISVTQTGTNQITAAVWSLDGNTFDDDVFSSTGTYGSSAVLMTSADKLLDSVADASGTSSAGVRVNAYAGNTIVVRNVTASASGTNSAAVFLSENPNGSPNPCPAQPLTLSLRNVIAESSLGSSFAGAQNCLPSGVANFDVDYSDFHPTTPPTGVTVTAGGHNIDVAPLLNADFSEKPGSPTIDKGTNDPQNGATDPDGRPRFLGSAPDMGAYEYPAAGAVTEAATDVTKTDARINGTVDSEGTGSAISWAFEWGTSPSLGNTVPMPDATLPGGSHPIPFGESVDQLLTGLQPGTTYYYRVRATNADGETFGAVRTFTTNPNVTVTFAGSGHGVVNSSPNIGGCDVTCTLSAQAGTTYTLTPIANSGSVFTGWSGACQGTGTCTLTPTANTAVTATFTKEGKPTLTGVKLTGVAEHKPKLRFTVTQGSPAPALKRLEITLAGGFTLGKLHHAIRVNDHLARARVAHGVLIIKLPLATPQLKITLISPAITEKSAKHHPLRLTVTVKDAGGTKTVLVHNLK
jgi:hypothetical protein